MTAHRRKSLEPLTGWPSYWNNFQASEEQAFKELPSNFALGERVRIRCTGIGRERSVRSEMPEAEKAIRRQTAQRSLF